ncbi:putative RNA-directed DNA polymerase from transposon BS [Trichonephila clavipes]|nr:putative RNA-directed DNA polymerase from transposon BS [Trichonephila clavipes]
MLTPCQGAPDFWTNRSCQITPFIMNLTSASNHTALLVGKVNKGRVLSLGRGLRAKNLGDPVFLADFSMHELLLALNSLDPKKSPGPDNIHRVKITHLGPSGTQRLLDIFNQSWKSGRLPHKWKRATIIPIRKPGKVPLRVIGRLL